MIKLHNTLTGQLETFRPVKDNFVRMYVCGITPYDKVHLGHARCYVTFDVIRRYLKYRGYSITYIQNFTDIDDKIIKRSAELKTSSSELAQKFIDDYFTQMRKLNIMDADLYPRVTEKIPEIIALIEKIIKNGFGYTVDGDVYFSVRKFSDYGKLSNRNIEELKIGARVQPDEQKNDPLDFALWKNSKGGEPSWNSPWGKGRPGWHIECSAMSLNEFGFETFDIHGGGQDLVFPHHENEIAQSEASTGKQFAKYFIHNGFVTINNEKMSKSLGNFFTLEEIFRKYEPMVVRYFLLSQHYRTPLDFSDDKLEQAKNSYQRILNAIENSNDLMNNLLDGDVSEDESNLSKCSKIGFEEAMDDDFNTAEALAQIHAIVNHLFILQRDKPHGLNKNIVKLHLTTLLKLLDILGFKCDMVIDVPEEILTLAKQREEARKNKNWRVSDELREKIKSLGFAVEDTKSGPKIKKL